MKKFLTLFLAILIPVLANAEVLTAGVSIDEVPKALFGSWRINAVLDSSNSYGTFKPQSIDFWDMSRIGDSITLDNPFTGAKSTISLKNVEGNVIVFSKKSKYGENKLLTDTVTIRLDGNNFSGINSLSLESYSLIDNHLMKTETATYKITGEKIAGESVLK